MKQSIRKLFSLLLAVVMVLSLAVPAFAAEGDKELRFAWLMNNGNGFYAEDIVLNGKDNPFEGELNMNPAEDRYAIFFIWNNKDGKRENFVAPKGDGSITVAKLSKDEIAKDAKESQYYVKVHMNEFKDGEITASGLSFKVIAKLGDFGFYSAATPSADTILGNEVEAAKLTGNTLYFCAPYMGTAEAAGRGAVTKVEKDPNTVDFNKLYDVESVKNGLWKITINDMGKNQLKQGGGIWVNLKLEVKDPDGNTHEEGRSINVKGEERGPELFFADLADEWDDAGNQSFFVNKDYGGQGNGKQVHVDYERVGIFGTIKEGQNAYTDHGFNWDAFTPVDVKTLKAPAGLTVESVSDQAKKGENWAKYFAKVSVAENGKEYKVTSGDYSITISSKLPDIGVYSAPTASFDSWLGEWGFGFHPAYADQPYYIISTAADDDGLNNRHLTGAKLSTKDLPEDCGNALMELAKVSDNVYKLSFKKGAALKAESFRVYLDLTWTDFMGNTWTDEHCSFGFDPSAVITASGTALTSAYYDPKPFAEVAGKVNTSVTMNAGEKKTVYLYACGMRQGEFIYVAWDKNNAPFFRSSDPALTLSFDEKDPAKFTLSASKTGTYEIWVGGESYDWDTLTLYHADGSQYTKAEFDKFYEEVEYTMAGGVLQIVDEERNLTPFTEVYPGEKFEIKALGVQDYGFQHLTVTVTGEAKTFTDVKASDWFCKEVNWAVAQGIAAGTSATTFSPKSDCTHAEILTFLWRAAGQPKSTAALPFTPKNTWAAGALAWAYEKGMIGASFSESAKCTSADAVNYIWQAKGKPAASYDGRFTDVPKDAAYAEAVAWAVNAGVTVGTTSTTFDPAAVCSRGRIATFLFRAFSK